MECDDPFTGIWTFNPERSRLSSPPPRAWTQQIAATPATIEVRETIVRADGSTTELSVSARFDGAAYAVAGSAAVDNIACTRPQSSRIRGTGKKRGGVALSETATVSADGRTLPLDYVVQLEPEKTASGHAVFEKQFRCGA